MTSNACPFLLTRGIREGRPCGKPVYKKLQSPYCLQHHRALEEMKAQQSSLIQQYMPPVSPSLQPMEILAHAASISPSSVQEEVLEEGTTEQVTETLIDLLSELKKEIKHSKNKQN